MPKASPMITSLNAGELSPDMRGRVDLQKYGNGCEVMENFTPLVSGAARKRPGTRFVNTAKDSLNPVRLIPFQYSTEQAYVLEFGTTQSSGLGYVRFYANGGLVVDEGGTPVEVVTPYTGSWVKELKYVQSADVLYIVHPFVAPRKLIRNSPTSWSLTAIEFKDPVFQDENTTDITNVADDVTGTVTVTTSATGFQLFAQIGDYIRFIEPLASRYDLWEPGKSITAGDKRRYADSLYEATTAGTTGGRPPIHRSAVESDGGVEWTYLHDGFGYGKITGFPTATTATLEVVSRLPDSALTATTRWATSEWNLLRGYPRTVAFYEDRLWFAGTSAKPQTLWASVTSDYENFRFGTRDDDALSFTINSRTLDAIEWLVGGKVLSIGTLGNEYSLSATQISDPVTPTNIKITPQTAHGTQKGVTPLNISNVIVFVQRSGRRLREYVYNFDTDSYVATDLNVLANHVLGTGVTDLAFQQEPNQVVWGACSCGALVGMTYERDEEVVGWHRHNIGGQVESLCTIPHWDGDQDVLWMVVRRNIDGTNRRYIEYMEKPLGKTDAFYVDSGLSRDGAPVTTLIGLNHLEGKEVAILVDGAIHPNRVVTGGSVTLDRPASKVTVGLPFTARLRTMPLNAGAADGTSQGKPVRINNVTFRLLNTGPGLFYGPGPDKMDEYHPRRTTDLMDNKVPTFTGDTELLAWPGEYQTGGPQIELQHRLPQECTILAIMPQLNTYDR